MVKHKNKVAIVLLIAMLITGLMGILAPVKTYADVNAGGETGGNTSTNTGTSSWKIPRDAGLGYRFSLYWAPDKSYFDEASKRNQVKQVGSIIDVVEKKLGGDYFTSETVTTGKSTAFVLEGQKKRIRIDKFSKVDNWGEYKMYNGNPPFIIPKGGSDRWVKYFQVDGTSGDNVQYKNIDAVAKAMGVRLSNEDFRMGKRQVTNKDTGKPDVQYGHYELYIEPIFSAIIGGQPTIISSRYAQLWERAYEGKYLEGKDTLRRLGFKQINGTNDRILRAMPTVFRQRTNEVHLTRPHTALDLGLENAGNLHYSNNTSFRNELLLWKAGKVYSAMGVGVISPPAKEAPKNKVLVSYVKVVDYKDGKFVYETIKETEEEAVKYIKGKEAEGILDIDAVREVEEGTAVLNDVITTKNDYTEKVVEKKKEIKDLVWETGIQPKLKEEPVVEPEELY